MRRYSILLALAILFAGCRQQTPPEEDSRGKYFYKFRMDGMSFSQDERRVLRNVRSSDKENIIAIDFETGQHTTFLSVEDHVEPLGFFGGDGRLLYLASPKGNSIYHLFIKDRAGRQVDLTPWPGVQVRFYAWNRERTGFYFGSNKENRRYWYTYRINVADQNAATVLQTQDMKFAAVCPNERYLALWKEVSPNHSEIYIYDLEKKELNKVAPNTPGRFAVPQVYDKRPTLLYYLTTDASHKTKIMKYDLGTQEHTALPVDATDAVFVRQSYGGRYLVIGISQNGQLSSRLIDLENGKPVDFSPGALAVIFDISRTERWVLFAPDLKDSPGSLKIYDLHTGQTRKVLQG